MTDEEIKEYINKIFINIAYFEQEYLYQQPSDIKYIHIEAIPSIVKKAIKKAKDNG